jgi:hypothetical protein
MAAALRMLAGSRARTGAASGVSCAYTSAGESALRQQHVQEGAMHAWPWTALSEVC